MKRTYFLFVAAVLLLHFVTTSSASIIAAGNHNNTADLNALLALKTTIFDPQRIIPTNWSNSNSVCNWIGITCNTRHQRVAAINLSYMGIVGTIPPELGNLSFLVWLNVRNNSFHGHLPPELSRLHRLKYINLASNDFEGEFPSWLGCLSAVWYINFEHNRFSGSLSGRLSNLTKLEVIGLGDNFFTGNLSEEFSALPKLRVLEIQYNQLVGPLPWALFNLSSLQTIAFTNNSLSGYLPTRICDYLPQLQGLYLSWNYFEVPQEVGNLSKLEVIQLSSNRLTGPITPKLFNISTLQFISLSENSFSGELPWTLGVSLPNLEELYLGGNRFTGAILTSISNASRLRVLDIGINHFTGAIPHSLGNLGLLEVLSVTKNDFFGDLRSNGLSFITSLANCKNLKSLRINGNPLNGFLPKSIGNLSSSLESFHAGSCGIKSEIPSSIGNLSNLVELFFENNSLTGLIPTTIKWFLKLQRIDLSGNQILGAIPSEFCNLVNLGELTLGQNMFSGMVPSCLGNVTTLRYVYLNSNNLSSVVPTSFWSLRYILELDMSGNYLTGSLPAEIGNFKVLVYLNLSNNQYLDRIPSTIGALQDLQELSLERNMLQGLIPDSMKNMLQLRHLDLSFNNLEGEIPNSLQVLPDLQYFNVSYNRLRGPIPHGGPFANFTSLSFLSNEALCGAPWLQPCASTFEHESRTKRIVMIVLWTSGSVILALVISIFLIRLKLRKKILAPTQNLLPTATFERVSFHELRQITNGFSKSNLLGSGGFGSVYKGICENGMVWAIKVFDLQLEGAFKSFDRECEVLSCLRHRNLTRVITACSSLDFKALVLEYMPNGSLEKWLHVNYHVLSIKQRLGIMIDVASGLEYLHYGYSMPIVHCDLKPSNILLDEDMVGHICDFGIAKLLVDGESVIQTKTLATFGYIAPEYGLEGLISTRSDVYSFGIILMETFTKRKPKDEMFTEELNLRRWIQECLPDSVIQVIDADLLHPKDKTVQRKIECVSSILKLSLSCTTDAPEERINMKEVLGALQKIKLQVIKDITP
ncbi:unnamed protein product [Coffea canephora]|uniref:non-specific serine/threonine protein kinase n=1 Tax=Coffea canephora TaxID=49390 RepID=A0A068UTS6_COFCA|nr:unnamed protein product [Coffea canephora]